MSLLIETIIGIGLALAGIFLIRRLYPGKDHAFWRSGLVVAAIIYVAFALFGSDFSWLLIELGGFSVYLLFAILSKRYKLIFLAIGWGLHVLWDVWLHPDGHPGYVPDWYPGVCLGFDLVIGAYIAYLAFSNRRTSVPSDSPPAVKPDREQ